MFICVFLYNLQKKKREKNVIIVKKMVNEEGY